MDRGYFDNVTDRFRSPHLWKREDDSWQLRSRVFDEPEATDMGAVIG
jgi:hypothetical protein